MSVCLSVQQSAIHLAAVAEEDLVSSLSRGGACCTASVDPARLSFSFLVDICIEVRIEIPSCSHFVRDSLYCQVLNARPAGVRCQPVQRRWRLRGVDALRVVGLICGVPENLGLGVL